MEVPSSPGSRRITGSDMTRRDLMEVAVVTGGALVGGQLMPGFIPQAAAQAGTPPNPLELVLRVNGTEHRLTLDPRTTLLDALRGSLSAASVASPGVRSRSRRLWSGRASIRRRFDRRRRWPRRARRCVGTTTSRSNSCSAPLCAPSKPREPAHDHRSDRTTYQPR
jgi:hypothetical protein